MLHHRDIIVAPATPTGGALTLIRLSGGGSIALCDKIFRGRAPLAKAKGFTLHYGDIVDGEQRVDDVLLTLFRAPHSYTGEESIELSCHGSSYIANRIIELCVAHGARMATAGEFTMRAFLNGKLDLMQAEAVADLISAESVPVPIPLHISCSEQGQTLLALYIMQAPSADGSGRLIGMKAEITGVMNTV